MNFSERKRPQSGSSRCGGYIQRVYVPTHGFNVFLLRGIVDDRWLIDSKRKLRTASDCILQCFFGHLYLCLYKLVSSTTSERLCDGRPAEQVPHCTHLHISECGRCSAEHRCSSGSKGCPGPRKLFNL